MDDFTRQCLFQNLADYNAGRISNDKYMNTLLSLFRHKAGGYINDQEYVLYPDCRPKGKIVFSDSESNSDEE